MISENVLEKTNRINQLFDFYEPLLTDKQQTFMKIYFQDNYSLGEIASEYGISRQAIYEHIKRAEFMLEEYELKLKLLAKHDSRLVYASKIEVFAEKLPEDQSHTLKKLLQEFVQMD